MSDQGWRKSKDPCPKCGSTKTVAIDWQNHDLDFPSFGGGTGRVSRPVTYRIQCQVCKHCSEVLCERQRGEAHS